MLPAPSASPHRGSMDPSRRGGLVYPSTMNGIAYHRIAEDGRHRTSLSIIVAHRTRRGVAVASIELRTLVDVGNCYAPTALPPPTTMVVATPLPHRHRRPRCC